MIKALLQKNDELHRVRDFTETGFVFAPFDDEKEVILFPENASENLILEKLDLPEFDEKQGVKPGEASEEGKQAHLELVRKAVKTIETGEMQKVVLSRREEVDITEEDPFIFLLIY